jgi:hypothetical protein
VHLSIYLPDSCFDIIGHDIAPRRNGGRLFGASATKWLLPSGVPVTISCVPCLEDELPSNDGTGPILATATGMVCLVAGPWPHE